MLRPKPLALLVTNQTSDMNPLPFTLKGTMPNPNQEHITRWKVLFLPRLVQRTNTQKE
jgi:hypothetical protein